MSKEQNQHPEQAEGAQGDKEVFHVEHRTNACSDVCDSTGKVFATCAWTIEAAHRAELICHLLNSAALAQPSPSYAGFPKPTVLKDCDVRYAANASSTAVNPGAPLPGCINAQPSPAPELERLGLAPHAAAFNEAPAEALKPELERPEVMAVLVLGGVFDGRELGDNDVVTVNPAIERLQAALVTDGEVLVELMTVAQHERICAQWASLVQRAQASAIAVQAELETERMRLAGCGTAALGYFDGCAEAYKSASLSDVLSLREKFEAAQARLAAIEQQEPVAHLRASDLDRLRKPGVAGCGAALESKPRDGFVPIYLAPVGQAGQVPEGEVITQHSGCGRGRQVDQITVSMYPGDKVVMVRGAIGKAFAAAPAQGGE